MQEKHNFFGDIHASIIGCTITGGSAELGGGIYVDGEATSNVLVRQTVVAKNGASINSPDIEVDGDLLFEGQYNLVGDGSGSTLWDGLDHNIVGDAFTPEDPMLAPPLVGSNGTMYRPSQPGSPVRQAVPLPESVNEFGGPLMEDQLGGDRAGGGMADIGAIDS